MAQTSAESSDSLPDPTKATLDLGPHPKNIFVTQLNHRDDEQDQQLLREVPVVAETGGKLLETGVNTLQKTLVLKKEAQLSKIDQELADKRRKFRERMAECDSKKIALAEQQQSMKERVAKFEKFIQENEAKRRRAIQRYQTESKLRALKEREEEELRSYLELLRRKQSILSSRVHAYKRFETYLLSVIDILPPDYIKVSDNAIGGLILRYNTLDHTFNRLQLEMNSVQEQLVELRDTEARMRSEHARDVLAKNSQLAELHSATEKQKGNQEMHEQQVSYVLQNLRDKSENFGMILRAIDNVALKCLHKHDKAIGELTFEEKLDRVRDHILDISHVVAAVEAGVEDQ